MSLLRNIWRPNEGPSKGPGSPPESVLTERLAELLGREGEGEEEQESSSPQDLKSGAGSHLAPAESGGVAAASLPGEDSESIEAVHTTQSISPLRRPPNSIPPGKPPVAPTSSGPSLASIARATEEALEHLKEAEERIEAELRDRVEGYGHALEVAITGTERGAAPEKPFEEAAARFRGEARDWFDEARRELREQLEASRTSLEAELRRNQADLLETARQKIEAVAQASLETKVRASNEANREQVARWLKEQTEASRRQAETGTQNLAQATEQAMARLRAMEEKIESTFHAHVEDYRRAVEAAVGDLERNGISQAKFQQAAEELQKVTDQALERSSKRIEERTEQAMNTLGDRLAAVERSLDGAARASLEAALQEQRERLISSWQEQSRSALDTVSQAAEQSKAQLEEARKAAEAGFRNVAQEQSRRVVESAAQELRSESFRQELMADASAQIERTAQEWILRSSNELQQQGETTLSGLTTTLKQASRKFIDEMQQRLDAAGRSWFESAGQAVQEEYRTRIAAWLEEQTQAARRQSDAAGQAVARLAEQATSRLGTISREAETSFRSRIEEQQKHWIDSTLETARKSGIEQRLIDQALAELEKAAAKSLEQSAQRLTQQAEASRTAISAEMNTAAQKLLEGVESSFESISWQHRGRLGQWWEERQQVVRKDAEATAESIARAAQQAASQLRSVQGEVEAELKNHAREHQTRLLDAALDEMRHNGAIDRAVAEATGALRTSANDILGRSSEQLREQIEGARLAVDNQAQASRRSVAEELARMAEQAQSSVESAGKAVTEDYRRQLSVWWEERTQSARRESEEASTSLSRSSRAATEQLQSMRKEIENDLRVGIENYRKGLREAAAEEIRRQGFQKEALETIAAELDKAAREMAVRSTQELQQHIDGILSGLDEKLKNTRQGFLDDTGKKLSEMAKTAIDTSTTRFHEFLANNVKELEHEQEEWLQRKRESVWLDVNKLSAPPAVKHAALEKTLLRETAEAPKKAGSSVLAGVLTVLAVIAFAAALTAIFVRMAPQKTITMELRSDPPSGFAELNPAWNPARRAQELHFAQAYWMIAINSLQHQYSFNTPLPSDPPPGFKVQQPDLKDDAATRQRYWNKIRQVWASPADWQQIVSNGGGTAGAAMNWMRQKFFTMAEKTPSAAN